MGKQWRKKKGGGRGQCATLVQSTTGGVGMAGQLIPIYLKIPRRIRRYSTGANSFKFRKFQCFSAKIEIFGYIFEYLDFYYIGHYSEPSLK